MVVDVLNGRGTACGDVERHAEARRGRQAPPRERGQNRTGDGAPPSAKSCDRDASVPTHVLSIKVEAYAGVNGLRITLEHVSDSWG